MNVSLPSSLPLDGASPCKRVRVAVVYHFFAHYRGPVMRELLERGTHDYLLVGARRDPADSGIIPWEVNDPAAFLEAPARFWPFGILWQERLIGLAFRRDLDAIVFLGDPHFLSTWVSAVIARLRGKRVLFWTIGWLREESGPKAWVRWLFLRIPHALVLYGHYAKMIGLTKGFRAERMHVVYNSLDYTEQKRQLARLASGNREMVRSSLFHEAERPLLICVTRLVRKRGLDLLLEAMVLLKAQGHPMNLLLVGDGPEREALGRYAAEHDLSVAFYGACYEEQRLCELVTAADATVAPGMVGLAAMQSLAYGTPVVTHNDPNRQAPEWEAVVPGMGGTFFRFGDSKDLARAITECVETYSFGSPARARADAVVRRFFNPAFQRRVIERAVCGYPADDLHWMRSAVWESSETS